MNTKTDLTRTFRAEDSSGRNYLIEEYIVYEEVLSGKESHWKKLECFLFLNGNLVEYNEDEQIFIVMESNSILKRVC